MLVNIYLQGDQIKEDGMDWTCSMYNRQARIACSILATNLDADFG
jgi:hypothetical protein